MWKLLRCCTTLSQTGDALVARACCCCLRVCLTCEDHCVRASMSSAAEELLGPSTESRSVGLHRLRLRDLCHLRSRACTATHVLHLGFSRDAAKHRLCRRSFLLCANKRIH